MVFDPERYVAPVTTTIAPDSLETLFVRVERQQLTELIDWPWTSPIEAIDPAETPWAWLSRNTSSTVLAKHIETPLAQSIEQQSNDVFIARYLYDHRYLLAHPQVQIQEHLMLVHATIASKLYDEGTCILDHEGVCASMHWRSVRSKGTTLSVRGDRQR